MIIDLLKGWLASRPRKENPTYVVLHADAGRWAGSLATLRNKGLSYHYYIHKSGKVTKCVPASRIAFHAGVTEGGEDGTRVQNENSVGVCFENLNDGKDEYTEAQFAACHELVAELKRNMPSLTHVTTHRLITLNPDRSGRSRKTDPVNVSANRFALKAGLKVWVPWQGAK